MTVLYDAHRYIEQLAMDRDLMHLRDRLAPEVAEMVYYGFWYCPKFDSLLAFNKEAQKPVTGSVTLDLYKGNISVADRSSPNSLYDDQIATMEGGGSYNQDDAEGFFKNPGASGTRSGERFAPKILRHQALPAPRDAKPFANPYNVFDNNGNSMEQRCIS